MPKHTESALDFMHSAKNESISPSIKMRTYYDKIKTEQNAVQMGKRQIYEDIGDRSGGLSFSDKPWILRNRKGSQKWVYDKSFTVFRITWNLRGNWRPEIAVVTRDEEKKGLKYRTATNPARKLERKGGSDICVAPINLKQATV